MKSLVRKGAGGEGSLTSLGVERERGKNWCVHPPTPPHLLPQTGSRGGKGGVRGGVTATTRPFRATFAVSRPLQKYG